MASGSVYGFGNGQGIGGIKPGPRMLLGWSANPDAGGGGRFAGYD